MSPSDSQASPPGGNPQDRVRVVLVGTSHPGNMGSAARAMKTMGYRQLVLVAPRHPPEHPQALALASGAADLLEGARVVPSLAEALADVPLAAGFTVRRRYFPPPRLHVREAALELAAVPDAELALVFGPEQAGLDNDDLKRCQMLVTIPVDGEYGSLNLAQAVQVACYEMHLAQLAPPPPPGDPDDPLASGAELEAFFSHLEQSLTALGYFQDDKAAALDARLRRLFGRARLMHSEIRLLHGVLREVDRLAAPAAPGRAPSRG